MGPCPSSTTDEDDMKRSAAGGAVCQRRSCPVAWASCVMMAALAVAVSAWAKLDTWRQEGASAFAKHHRERVVISDQGHARLGQALLPTGPLAAERVWDLARASDGTVYAATGDAGKVFRQSTKEGAAWTVAFDAADTQALALAATPRGEGLRGHRARRPGDRGHRSAASGLPSRSQGAVHLGPRRRRRKATCSRRPARPASSGSAPATASGRSSSIARQLTCCASRWHPTARVYAGSDGEGLIYPDQPRGQGVGSLRRTSVGDPDPAPGTDGSLYAGTAAEAGGARRESCSIALLDPRRRCRAPTVSTSDPRFPDRSRAKQSGRQISDAQTPPSSAGRRSPRPGPRRPAPPHPSRSPPAIMPSTGSMPTA